MKNKLNVNERHIVNVLLFLASAYGLVIIFINSLLSNPQTQTQVSIGFIILSGIVLFFGQDYMFGSFLMKIVPATKAKRGIADGQWNIRISYKEKTQGGKNKEIIRNGSLRFSNSMVGVKIYGSELIDNETKSIEKECWLADDAELIVLDDKEILVYLYKIPKNKSESNFEKAGIVVAVNEAGDGSFKGMFKDISLVGDKTQREGEVILFRADA